MNQYPADFNRCPTQSVAYASDSNQPRVHKKGFFMDFLKKVGLIFCVSVLVLFRRDPHNFLELTIEMGKIIESCFVAYLRDG